MGAIDDLSPHARDGAYQVVIEVPKGSRNKVAWDPECAAFVLRKILPVGASFPFDFGFVPGTLGEDGDPLDVLVLMDEPAFCGCVVPVRLVGALGVIQGSKKMKVRNDRLVAVAVASRERSDVRRLADLPDRVVDEIEHFFASYLELEGQTYEGVGRWGPKRAEALVKAGVSRRREKRGA